MNSIWSKRWKKVLIWFSAYFSFLAFALVGGYVIVKDEDEDLKATAKQAFIVILIFAAISACLSFFGYIGSFSDSFYNSAAYDIYSTISTLANHAKTVVYVVFTVLALVSKDNE